MHFKQPSLLERMTNTRLCFCAFALLHSLQQQPTINKQFFKKSGVRSFFSRMKMFTLPSMPHMSNNGLRKKKNAFQLTLCEEYEAAVLCTITLSLQYAFVSSETELLSCNFFSFTPFCACLSKNNFFLCFGSYQKNIIRVYCCLSL